MSHYNENTTSELWNNLQNKGLVEGDVPSTELDNTPWFVKTLQGFAGWIAAFFLLGFFASGFIWLFDRESAFALISIGLIGNVSAFMVFRLSGKNEFLHQLGLVFNLCGQLMVAWGLYEIFRRFGTSYFLILAFYQIILVLLVPDFVSRVLTTWFAVLALYIGLGRHGIFYITGLFVLLGFSFIWTNDNKWLSKKNLWEPIGYGLMIALIQFNGQFLFDGDLDWWFYAGNYSDWNNYFYWINEIVFALVFIGLFIKLSKEYCIDFSTAMGRLSVIGLLMLLVLGYYITGVSAAFLLLIIGFWKKRKVLLVFGVIALVSFISWYYYSLHLTLLTKSLVLIATGMSFFIGFYWLNVLSGGSKISFTNLKTKYEMSQVKWIAIATMVIVLVLVNHDVYKKEQILSNGQIVLLKLAPVDPRSLMQGDYMRLRFAIESEILDKGIKNDKDSMSNKHFLIVNLDENNVGRLADIGQTENTTTNQVKMQFKLRNNHIRLATHAFFFQEGTAKKYEAARYGEFRVAKSGQLLLNNLRDESFTILGFNRP